MMKATQITSSLFVVLVLVVLYVLFVLLAAKTVFSSSPEVLGILTICGC